MQANESSDSYSSIIEPCFDTQAYVFAFRLLSVHVLAPLESVGFNSPNKSIKLSSNHALALSELLRKNFRYKISLRKCHCVSCGGSFSKLLALQAQIKCLRFLEKVLSPCL